MAVLKIRDKNGDWIRVPSLAFANNVHLDDVLTDSGESLLTILNTIRAESADKMSGAVYASGEAGVVKAALESRTSGNGVTVCEHSKDGTVHTLTADNMTDVLFFTASDSFETGDTFRMGEQVLEPVGASGLALAQGAFQAGNLLHCLRRGEKLWFLSCAGQTAEEQPEEAGSLLAVMSVRAAAGGFAGYSIKDSGQSITACVQSYDDYDSDAGHLYQESKVLITIDGAELGDEVSFSYTMSAVKWVSVSISGTDTPMRAALSAAYTGKTVDKSVQIAFVSGMTDARLGLTLADFKIGKNRVLFSGVAQ